MLSAYVDDSGNSEKPVYVVAGFISTPARWEAFSDEWRNILSLTPRIEYFKGGEAFNLRGQFHNWTESDRDTRLLLLVDVIKKHAIAGFIASMAYESVEGILAAGKIGKYFNIVQLLNFISLLSLLHSQSFGEPSQKIQLVLDHSIYKGYPKRVFKDYPFIKLNRLHWPPDEKDDLSVLPLQAADMFAWLWRNQAKRYWDNQPQLPIMERVIDAINPLPIHICEWGRREVLRATSRLPITVTGIIPPR